MRSHPGLMLLLRNGRILLKVRRLALIAVGAAVAAVLLLPAAAAWLREPTTPPLPQPLGLQRAVATEEADRVDRRVRNWPFVSGRRVQRLTGTLRQWAVADAGPINLAPAATPRASGVAAGDDDEPSDDDDEPSDADDEPSDEADEGGDGDDGNELGDG